MGASTAVIYQWLEPKPRKRTTKQLGIKRRNMLAWHLVAPVLVGGEAVEFVAQDYRLPVEAVREAIDSYNANKEWIDAEVDEDARACWLR